MKTEERRNQRLDAAYAEVRADDAGERFVGLASPVSTRTAIGNPKTWGFLEEFGPGAFTKTLSEGDQRMLIDHDPYYVVSRVSAGTLRLSQSARGLEVDSALDTGLSYVADLRANLRNGNITGMSIGFLVEKERWEDIDTEDDEGRTYVAELRTVLEARLIEVSAVTFPAYDSTEAELNSVAAALTRRADPAAIERRAAYRPELRTLLQPNLAPADGGGAPQVNNDREPEDSTRASDTAEPAETTPRHVNRVDLVMRGYAARYPRLRARA